MSTGFCRDSNKGWDCGRQKLFWAGWDGEVGTKEYSVGGRVGNVEEKGRWFGGEHERGNGCGGCRWWW